MNSIYGICIGLSIGIIVGFICGGIKMALKKSYSERRKQMAKKFIDFMAFLLKYFTFLMLTLGLVWCVYFLILGSFVPSKADYANNMAELIVAVLTVISIIFAFVEFLRRSDDKKQ